jgi:hypothetical protein
MVSKLGPSKYNQKFVSGGSKNYAYKVLNKTTGKSKTMFKVKGLILNYNAKHLVNLDIIRNTTLNSKDGATDTVTVRTDKIKRKRNKCDGDGSSIQIVKDLEHKKYRVFHQAAQTK